MFGYKRSYGGNWGFNADQIFFNDYGGTQKAIWGFYQSSQYTKGITFVDTSTITFGYPQTGVAMVRARKADNSGYWKVFETDASNRLVINSETNSIYTYSPDFTFNTLATITTNDANPIQIGNASKKSYLSVYAPSTTVFTARNTASSNQWTTYVNNDNIVYALPAGTAYAQFYTNSAKIFGANGRIGIGSVSAAGPQALLHVRQTSDAAGGGFYITNLNSTHGFYQYLDVSGDFLWQSTQQRMKLTQAGKLLIAGAGTPNVQLEVNTAGAVTVPIARWANSLDSIDLFVGTSTPESAVTASQGDFMYSKISSTGRWWGKATGTGNTGWVEFYHTGNLPAIPNSIYTGNGTLFAGGPNISFTGTNPLKIRASSSSSVSLEQKIYDSGTSGYFDKYKINSDSLETFYTFGRFGTLVTGAPYTIQINDGEILLTADSIRTSGAISSTSLQKIYGENGNNVLQQVVGINENDVLAWDSIQARWEVRAQVGSGGNGIYGGDGNIPTGGSQVAMNNIGETVRFVMNTGNTTTREMIRLETVDNAFTRFFVLKGPTDSLRIFRASSGRKYTMQSYGGSAFEMASDSILSFLADSLLYVEGSVQTKTKMRFILGLTPSNYIKRVDGDATVGGDALVSDGTDWSVSPIMERTSTTSATGTLNLTTSSLYVFTGTTTTWTLPTVAGNTNRVFHIKNRGSGAITLNSNGGSNDIYTTSAVNTITINAGESALLWNDGTYFLEMY